RCRRATGSARPPDRRSSGRASWLTRRGRAAAAILGLEPADLVAQFGRALELLALDRALELVEQALDLARARRRLAVANRHLALVPRVPVDAAQQRPQLELERDVALGAAEASRLAECRVQQSATRALHPADPLFVGGGEAVGHRSDQV